MKRLYIIVVDDHQLFREGLQLILMNFPFVERVSEASNGNELLAQLKAGRPDIVFMDVNMPAMNGIETTAKALELDPKLNIIALSMFGDEEYYTQMIAAGAKGFIIKNAGVDELETAILQIMEGKNYFSQEILTGLVAGISRKQQATASALSERETEVLYHICKGMSNQEIADQLFISKRTVDKHRENLLQKTGSRNTAGLVMYAIRNGIVEV